MSVSYPTNEQAVPEIATLVSMLRGQIPASTQVALKSGWVVQGYLQSLIAGQPQAAEASAEALSEISDAEALQHLAKMSEPSALGLLDNIGGPMVVKLLLPMLQKWMINWLQNGGLDKLIGQIQAGQ